MIGYNPDFDRVGVSGAICVVEWCGLVVCVCCCGAVVVCLVCMSCVWFACVWFVVCGVCGLYVRVLWYVCVVLVWRVCGVCVVIIIIFDTVTASVIFVLSFTLAVVSQT